MPKPPFGRIYKRGERWWIAFYDGHGREVRESSKSRKQSDAVALLRQRQAELLGVDLPGARSEVLVGELLDDLARDYRQRGRKTVWWCEMICETHLRPAFGRTPAANVGTRHINDYIDRRRAKAKPATVNHELALLRRAFVLGSKHEPPKVAKVPTVPTLREDNVRRGFFEDSEFRALRTALPECLRLLVTVAYHSGCRRGELLGLRWAQVDLAAKAIRLNPGETKNDQGRMLPLAGELLDMLTMARQARDTYWPRCQWVFHREGERIKNFRKAWETACEAAGIGGRLFHDFRRTAVRNLVRSGTPEVVAMRISGHKTRAIFDRYNIVSEADLHAAAERLERHLRKQVEPRRDDDVKGMAN